MSCASGDSSRPARAVSSSQCGGVCARQEAAGLPQHLPGGRLRHISIPLLPGLQQAAEQPACTGAQGPCMHHTCCYGSQRSTYSSPLLCCTVTYAPMSPSDPSYSLPCPERPTRPLARSPASLQHHHCIGQLSEEYHFTALPASQCLAPLPVWPAALPCCHR